MRSLFLAGLLLWLSACNDPQVDFVQPFPSIGASLTAFAAQHQGVYEPAGDTTYRLAISAHAACREVFQRHQITVGQLDSLNIPMGGRSRGRWYADLRGRYRLRPVRAGRRDSVWLERWLTDTICDLRPGSRQVVRWFKGSYYLNEPLNFFSSPDRWRVQRLLLSGRRLRLQQLGNDTARLVALPPGVVVRTTQTGQTYWLLNPSTPRQERQIARRDDLWETMRELERR